MPEPSKPGGHWLRLTAVGLGAPANQQYVPQTVVVNQTIPDNQPAGLESDLVTTDISNGSCSQVYGVKLSVSLQHPRQADLTIDLLRVSRANSSVLRTTRVFDGPQQAAGKTPDQIAKITISGDIDVDDTLRGDDDCGHWRLKVADVVAGNTGNLLSWTLKRRQALFRFRMTDRTTSNGCSVEPGPQMISQMSPITLQKSPEDNSHI